MTRKRGRPAKHYQTTWGELIEGLTCGKDGRFRPVGRGDIAFGSDEAQAVHRYRKWKAEQNAPDRQAEYDKWVHDPRERAALQKLEAKGHSIGLHERQRMLQEDRAYLRRLILTNPKQAAIELDIPHLAFYPKTPVAPSNTLAQLGEKYLNQARNKKTDKPLEKKNRANSATWWNEFLQIVQVEYARDLTKERMALYYDQIASRDYAAATRKNRLVKVKAILQWGLDKTNDTEDCRFALDNANSAFSIPEVDSEPCPIKPAEFHALLKYANTRMRAALLLGLNCAMHGGEIAKTRKADFDLDAQTFYAKRSKTSKRRIAWLWTRTADALRTYLAEHPHQSDYVFVSRTGKPLTGEALRQLFVTLRVQTADALEADGQKALATAVRDVKLEGLRDAAYTIANQVDSYYSRFVCGHTIKDESRKYVVRGDNPNVRACCEAIEREFWTNHESNPRGRKSKKGGTCK